jgi:hypothetical protein
VDGHSIDDSTIPNRIFSQKSLDLSEDEIGIGGPDERFHAAFNILSGLSS